MISYTYNNKEDEDVEIYGRAVCSPNGFGRM